MTNDTAPKPKRTRHPHKPGQGTLDRARERIEALEASHARLLEGLKKIAAIKQTPDQPASLGLLDAYTACVYQARAAIAEATKEE